MSYNRDNKNSSEDEYNRQGIREPLTAIEDLLDLTDTEVSSSSSDTQVYVRNDQFVLELHELKRDDLPDNPLPEVKTRKLSKKKKRAQQPPNQGVASNASSSPSESSVTPQGPEETHGKEEFYDAHESYHALPDRLFNPLVYARMRSMESFRDDNHTTIRKTQASAALAIAGIAQVLSEHGNVPKVTAPAQDPASGTPQAAVADQPAVAQEPPPTTITKPVTRPD